MPAFPAELHHRPQLLLIPLLTPAPICPAAPALAWPVALSAAACLQVQRAKKCLDFAGTILVIHLAVVTCFNGFPKSLAW